MIKDALISTIQMTTFDTINTYLFKKFTEWDDIQSASIIEIMKKHSEEKIKDLLHYFTQYSSYTYKHFRDYGYYLEPLLKDEFYNIHITHRLKGIYLEYEQGGVCQLFITELNDAIYKDEQHLSNI